MLPEVDQVILETIRENLDAVSKKDITIQRSDNPPKRTPAIYLWNRGFTASDISIGGNASDFEKTVREEFDGDGKKTNFQLSEAPLRPVRGVEHPRSRIIREGRDFQVNYAKGILTFPQPPEKGRRNILVQYSSGKSPGEIRGLRLKLIYNLDVWASAPEEQASLVGKLASVLLGTQESLANKGVQLRLTRGRDLTVKDGVPNGVLCKRLVCIAEADMLVKIPMKRMEKIQVTAK